MPNRLRFETVAWEEDHLRLLDQRKLPSEVSYVDLFTVEEVWQAIRNLVVRGAPAIGIAAGFGLFLAVRDQEAGKFEDFYEALDKAANYLESARPTGRNLKVILERLRQKALQNRSASVAQIKKLLLAEAQRSKEEDSALCEAIARHGDRLIAEGDGVMTHCNAGALATAGIGTALGIIYWATWNNKKITVYATETRPVLQGSRLTSWELHENGIPVQLICDGACGKLFSEGKVQKIFVGADRIVANGDTANKIGTYSIACLAAHHQIPFYVVAPTTTFDFTKRNGSEIPIELRSREELLQWEGKMIAPPEVDVYNPAFDVTPHELIRGIVTEKGIFTPPFEETLKALKGAS